MLNLKNKTKEDSAQKKGRAIDALFDPDNNDLMILQDESGKEISMRQRFAINVDSIVYAILQPSAYNPNFPTGATFVFRVNDDDSFTCVRDRRIERRVYKLYYETLKTE